MCSPLNVKNISRQRNRSSTVSRDPILHWITVDYKLQLLFTFSSGVCLGSFSNVFFCEIFFWFHFLFLLLSSKLSCSEADNNIRSGKCRWQDNSHYERTDRHTLKAGSRLLFPNTYTFSSQESFSLHWKQTSDIDIFSVSSALNANEFHIISKIITGCRFPVTAGSCACVWMSYTLSGNFTDQ